MSTTEKPARRTLSNAEDRRESVLAAAERICAAKGLYGTPTMEVAKAAGISQAYLFRLFPTKDDLALAVVRRSNERIEKTFVEAAARAKASGEDPMPTMGGAYSELIEDRDILRIQLHSHAAAISHPPIRDAMRDSFRDLHALIARETQAPDDEIRAFFATGMLCNVMSALDAYEIDEPWAHALSMPDDGTAGCPPEQGR
jgi:AcrR family transcriptional regulator